MKKKLEVITLTISNEFGVLTRVTSLIRREGWSIRSLAVFEEEGTETSRMTISLDRRHSTLEHVIDRLSRLSSVLDVSIYTQEEQISQELCLVRLDGSNPKALDELSAMGGVRRLEENEDGVLLSIRCTPQEVEAYLRKCREIGLQDIARTGPLALNKTAK